jgi:hypothetical protein
MHARGDGAVTFCWGLFLRQGGYFHGEEGLVMGGEGEEVEAGGQGGEVDGFGDVGAKGKGLSVEGLSEGVGEGEGALKGCFGCKGE